MADALMDDFFEIMEAVGILEKKETMIVKFLKHLLRWFLPECSRCGGVMLYDNTHSWHDKWHFVCDTCGREKWGTL
ncbi:MAG: hypothetical protein ACLRWM_01680 [Streptococcus sp.]